MLVAHPPSPTSSPSFHITAGLTTASSVVALVGAGALISFAIINAAGTAAIVAAPALVVIAFIFVGSSIVAWKDPKVTTPEAFIEKFGKNVQDITRTAVEVLVVAAISGVTQGATEGIKSALSSKIKNVLNPPTPSDTPPVKGSGLKITVKRED